MTDAAVRATWTARATGLAAVATVLLALSGCASGTPSTTATGADSMVVVAVPADAPTINKAVDLVKPGGLILVSPGTYKESVTIDKADVTLRGTDRNTVIIDGEGLRSNGVQVIADGVRIQNLTTENNTFNGVLVTGLHDKNGPQAHSLDGYTRLDPKKFPPLQRFEVSNVTASNNGLYGIYAFNSQHGVIRENYTSGAADSGFYVGQCANCNILVTGNVAENNAVGYENANASDSVLIAGNRLSENRVGLTLLSWYQEAYLPQKAATVVGNLISDNNSATSPSQALGAFGLGVGLSGVKSDTLERNRISGNSSTGVELTNTEDIASTGNTLTDNLFEKNGLDFADLSATRSPSAKTCINGSGDISSIPKDVASLCASTTPGGITASELPKVTVPAGMSFLKVPAGPTQPNLAGDPKKVPAALPASVVFPAASSFAVPDTSLLANRILTK